MQIEHKGTVVAVTERQVSVEIINRSACEACNAKSLCSLSNQKEKTIWLPRILGQPWTPGEVVVVSLRSSMGLKAVLISYIIPLLALLAALFGLSYLGVSEWITGVVALGIPLLCYFVVWLLRDRIEKKYIFVLKKLNQT